MAKGARFHVPGGLVCRGRPAGGRLVCFSGVARIGRGAKNVLYSRCGYGLLYVTAPHDDARGTHHVIKCTILRKYSHA